MPELGEIAGKTVVVTGASSGIGRQCCITCARLGARVIAWGRDERRLQETAGLLPGGGHQCVAHDLGDLDSLEGIVSRCVSSTRVDGFIHSAGIQVMLPARMAKPKDYLRALEINALAGFELARIFSLKRHCGNEGASYVFIGSVAAMCGDSGLCIYAASKGAVASGCRALAVEWAPRKIRVNWISAGLIAGTGMEAEKTRLLSPEGFEALKRRHPLGLGSPDDVAHMAAFLLSDAARWITGANMVVDGGFSAA